MLTITRTLEIDAGHRLLKHESKCKNLHGHRYKLEVTVSARQQDEVGRVIDFSKLKEICGKWLDGMWDHGFIYQEGDPIEAFVLANKMKAYVLAAPPTVENLVVHFVEAVEASLKSHGLTLEHVRMYETPNCWADWTRV